MSSTAFRTGGSATLLESTEDEDTLASETMVLSAADGLRAGELSTDFNECASAPYDGPSVLSDGMATAIGSADAQTAN